MRDAYEELADALAAGRHHELGADRAAWRGVWQEWCETSTVGFLPSLPQLTSLHLTNFKTGSEGELLAHLPELPSLRSLAIATEPSYRGRAGYEVAPGGPFFFDDLAEAFPSLSSLSVKWASTDDGISELDVRCAGGP